MNCRFAIENKKLITSVAGNKIFDLQNVVFQVFLKIIVNTLFRVLYLSSHYYDGWEV